MMETKLNQTLTALFLIVSIILNLLPRTRQDNPCPYPCYPPPTGPGTVTATPSTPASLSPPSQSGGLYPPPAGVYPPPAGNLPYYLPPPSGGYNLYGPPPPDSIMPYFPFYYRKPPHQTDASSAASLGKSVSVTATTKLLLSVFLVTFCLGQLGYREFLV